MNNYSGEKEWSIDITPNKEGRALLKKLGLADRLRQPKEGDTREETFLSFRHKEMKADGTRAEPIRIAVINPEWEGALIGNGSDIEIKFVVKDYGVGKKKGMYIRAIRVLDLVKYVSQDFAPLTSDDEFFSNQKAATGDEPIARLPEGMEPVVEDELDDDVAF